MTPSFLCSTIACKNTLLMYRNIKSNYTLQWRIINLYLSYINAGENPLFV